MQEHDRRPVSRAGLGVAGAQQARIDLLERPAARMDPGKRIELLYEAVAIARDLGDPLILVTMKRGLAIVLRQAARYDEALAALAECAPIRVPARPGLPRHLRAVRSVALARRSGR